MTDSLSATFGDWRDRLTYVVAEAQLLVAGVLVALGLALAWFNPSLPGIPPWVSKLLVGWLVLAPPTFLAGLRFARWLRSVFWPTVYHVNAITDDREKYHVPPEIWSEKTVNGAPPHRVNDGDDYEVREFDWAPEYGDKGTLTVKGTWLSQVQDAKLLTAKSHFERIHDELQDAFLELTYRRDAEDELANRLQKRIITRVVEARENGEMLAPDDVNDVIESFKDEMKERTGREELSEIRPDDLPSDGRPELPGGETTNPYAEMNANHEEPAATDGGTDE
jgi:hypothetical protein